MAKLQLWFCNLLYFCKKSWGLEIDAVSKHNGKPARNPSKRESFANPTTRNKKIRGVSVRLEGLLASRSYAFVNFCKIHQFLFSIQDFSQTETIEIIFCRAIRAPIHQPHEIRRIFAYLPSVRRSSLSKADHKSFVIFVKSHKTRFARESPLTELPKHTEITYTASLAKRNAPTHLTV